MPGLKIHEVNFSFNNLVSFEQGCFCIIREKILALGIFKPVSCQKVSGAKYCSLITILLSDWLKGYDIITTLEACQLAPALSVHPMRPRCQAVNTCDDVIVSGKDWSLFCSN